MDDRTTTLVMTLVVIALYALVIVSRSRVVGAAVSGIVLTAVSFILFATLIMSLFIYMIGGLFLAMFGITITQEGIARSILADKFAGLLTPLIYVLLVTPGLIAFRRGVPWRKAIAICLVPVILVAGAFPLQDYFAQRSASRKIGGEELSLPLPQRPRRLAIDQTVYDNANIGWRDPLEALPCTEFCLELLRSGQVDAIRLQRTVKLVFTKGGVDISSIAVVYRNVRGEICNSSVYGQPRAVAAVSSNDHGACILGEPKGLLPDAVEIAFIPVPDEQGASGQRIEISDGGLVLWRRATVETDVVSFPYMLDSDWRPFTHPVRFGSFMVPGGEARAMPDKLIHGLLTGQFGFELRAP